jgi:outer membrane receptor protein involved in Fe transport
LLLYQAAPAASPESGESGTAQAATTESAAGNQTATTGDQPDSKGISSPAEESNESATENELGANQAPFSQPETYPTIPVHGISSVDETATSETKGAVLLEDVVVTASKRDKSIRELPGSVGTVSGRQLEEMGAQSMEDYLKLVPGISIAKQDDNRNSLSIRGINSGTVLVYSQQPTGIYLDDVPLTDPFAPLMTPDLNPYDLERVEILKGPQGVLFGSNSLGGAIRYVAQKPQLGMWEGKVTATGNTVMDGARGASAAGAANVPLFGDDFAIRAAGSYKRAGGFIDDHSVGKDAQDVNGSVQRQGRVMAKLAPIEFPVTFLASYVKQVGDLKDFNFADQPQTLDRSDTPGPNTSHSDFSVASLVAQYDFSAASFQSTTSRTVKSFFGVGDVNRLLNIQNQNTLLYVLNSDGHARGLTQEVRITSLPEAESPWEWLVGLWYMHEPQDSMMVVYDQNHPLLPPIYTLELNSKGSERALFFDLTRKLSDSWRATLGGRYYNTRLKAHSVAGGLETLAAHMGSEATTDSDVNEKGLTPKASLTYDINKNMLAYILASKGFRFGGVQAQPPITTNPNEHVPTTYKSDTLWNYEIGTRTQWLHRRLTFDTTLFYEKWTNMQITQVSSTGLFTFVDNVGQAHSTGVEASLAFLPFSEGVISGLKLISNAAYIKAVTDVDFASNSGEVAPGTRLPGTPKFQIANIVSYTYQFGATQASFIATHSHIGKSFNDLHYTQELGGYDTYDVGLHVSLPALPAAPGIKFTINNLTDTRGLAGATADPTLSYRDIYFIRPRTIELSIDLRFY